MPRILLLKALGYSSIGLLFGAFMGVLLISARKEYEGAQPLSLGSHFVLVILGVCGFVALAMIFLMARL